MGRGTLAAGVTYRATSTVVATVLRLNPSDPAEASSMIEADIAAKLAMNPPLRLIDVDHDGGSDDAVILMSLLYSDAGPTIEGTVRARCWSASNATQAQDGLTAAIAASVADPESNFIILHGLAGCGQGHQFLGYLFTVGNPNP